MPEKIFTEESIECVMDGKGKHCVTFFEGIYAQVCNDFWRYVGCLYAYLFFYLGVAIISFLEC